MPKNLKKWIIQILKVAFSAGIIFWLVTSGKLNFEALRNVFTWQVGPWAIMLVLMNLALASERWRYLLKTQSVNTSPWVIFKLSLIGGFFNFAMPGGVGGDVVKAYYFTKDTLAPRVVAVTSVLFDRVLGVYSMVIMALLVMIYDYNHVQSIDSLHSLFIFISVVFALLSVGFALVFSKSIYEKAWLKNLLLKLPFSAKTMKLYESLHLYGKKPKTFVFSILLSLVAQTCSILFLALVGSTTGTVVPLQTYFMVAPLGFMVTAIPISPAGVGIGQAAFYVLFNMYVGYESELGPSTITAFQVVLFLISLAGALFYLRRKDKVSEAELEKENL